MKINVWWYTFEQDSSARICPFQGYCPKHNMKHNTTQYHENPEEWGLVEGQHYGLEQWDFHVLIQKDNNAAIVVCRMLGLSGGEAVVDDQKNRFGIPRTRHLQMTNVRCTGEENSIFDCPMKVDITDTELGCHSSNVLDAYLGIVCS